MKKSKLVVLRGFGRKGKTHTLNLLIEKLLRIGAVLDSKSPLIDLSKDRTVVLRLGEKKIGITTLGDNGTVLKTAFENKKLFSANCDLYVCASHTKGSSAEYCKTHFENILWQDKWGVSETGKTIASLEILQDKVNDIQALVLRDTILSWL